MDLGMRENKQIIKGHRSQGGTELTKPFRWRIEMPSLVVRRDDKDTHITCLSRLDGRPVILKYIGVPKIDVIKLIRLDGP